MSSFRGGGYAREPGSHEHWPEIPLVLSVFIGSGPALTGRPGTTREFFRILLSCSLSRVQTQFFVSAASEGRLIGAHSRRQDPKTPVEQALMRGLATA